MYISKRLRQRLAVLEKETDTMTVFFANVGDGMQFATYEELARYLQEDKNSKSRIVLLNEEMIPD